MTVFVGYDPREHVAAEVCAYSIRRWSPLPVQMLKWDDPLVRKVYRRPYHREHTQYVDDVTGAPFSTQFSFTRFLVPYLSNYKGWSLFCDCDFLFTAPISELFALADEQYAVMCVQHRHDPAELKKMDGVQQTRYRRKNWSSLVLWNCGHPSNRKCRPGEVNRMPGLWLHGFDWLDDAEIGELPVEWNYLVGTNTAKECPEPKGIHYTLGGPWFNDCQGVEYADEWRTTMSQMVDAA